MNFADRLYGKLRRMPTPALITVITAKFLFGLGLGAALAAPRGSKGRKTGGLIMLLTTLLSIPLAVQVLSTLDED